MAAILDAILSISNCSRVTTCHQAVSENREPWLPKSTLKNLIQQCKVKGKSGSWLQDYQCHIRALQTLYLYSTLQCQIEHRQARHSLAIHRLLMMVWRHIADIVPVRKGNGNIYIAQWVRVYYSTSSIAITQGV